MSPADLGPIEARLRLAARRYNEARRTERDRELSIRELEGLLRRFDCPLPDALQGAAQGAVDAERAPFPAKIRAYLERRTARELERLARYARSADPRYDVNRHMMTKRLARWLAGVESWYPPRCDRARLPVGPPKRRRRARETVVRPPAALRPIGGSPS